jgi:NADH:ubiquinone oxidoreductase subunit 6 (subunit J)
MIDWVAFVTVLVASIVGACGVVFLFSVGLRMVGSDRPGRRPIGVIAFVLCGLLVVYGVYLIIPAFHR